MGRWWQVGAVLVAALVSGCPAAGEHPSGQSPTGTPSAAQAAASPAAIEEPAPVDFNQLTLRWSQRLGADQRDFGEAYARATWLHLDLLAGDWDQARTDLNDLRHKVTGLPDRASVPTDVRPLVAALLPLVSELDNEVDRRDHTAILTAKKLVVALNRLAADPAMTTWLAQARHGGEPSTEPSPGDMELGPLGSEPPSPQP
jgi:hypothetical protein